MIRTLLLKPQLLNPNPAAQQQQQPEPAPPQQGTGPARKLDIKTSGGHLKYFKLPKPSKEGTVHVLRELCDRPSRTRDPVISAIQSAALAVSFNEAKVGCEWG